ncbi:SpoIIE family protein phosphatase [Streptomyces sp. NPDC050439]|uniref:PP2C family protein-serine/threonine phosphatase n=1 Tax=unclassified Streptomyces TaxID=2593676 RepID=UPI0034132ADA
MALTALLTSLDVTFHEQRSGIVVGLVAVPAIFLALPGPQRACQPYYVGGLALTGALVSSAVDWRDRPVVMLATIINIVLLTCVTGQLQRRRMTPGSPSVETPSAAPSSSPAAPQPAALPTPQRSSRTFHLGEAKMALCSLPQANHTTMVADMCDVRETPYGTRILVADLMGKDDATRVAGDHLLESWRHLAASEPSLAEITRRLDAELDGCSDRFAKTLLITLHNGRGEFVCCGHPPPLVLGGEGGRVREVSPLTPLPPLGLFSLVPHGCTVFTTSFTLRSTQQLLVYTDGVGYAMDQDGSPFPLLQLAQTLGDRPFAALLDALVTELDRHAASGLGGLRDEALLLLLQQEERPFQHVTTALRTPPTWLDAPTRPQADQALA